MTRLHGWCGIAIGIVFCVWSYAFPTLTWSQIQTDGSLGAAVTLPGPDAVIPPQVGQIEGKNLFHSFETFNVPTGGSATFEGPTNIENVVGRITGGDASIIDGTLRSTIPAANLFLLNPNGIMMGANAKLEIGGSFYMSTADELRFEDGVTFPATANPASVLSTSAPQAFGFLDRAIGSVRIEGSRLTVPRGETLSVSGGDIVIEGARLQAPSGTLSITSMAEGEDRIRVPLSAAEIVEPQVMKLGEITITDDSMLATEGNGGGLVAIRSGQLTMDQSRIVAGNDGNTPRTGASIDIAVTDTLSLRGERASLSVDSRAAGSSGDVMVTARVLDMQDSAAMVTQSLGRGTGGRIEIRAERVQLAGRSFIGTVARDNGQGGDVSIVADEVELTTGAQVLSSTFRNRRGAGNILITAADSLQITGTAEGRTGIFAQGGSVSEIGEIRIEGGSLKMDGGVIGTPASERTDATARAGNITVRVESLDLRGKASIDSRTLGGAAGGNIAIDATEANLSGEVTIAAGTRGGGDAGRIQIDTFRLTLTEGAHITSNTEGGSGNGGDVEIHARESIVVTGENSGIRSSASGSGAGGNVLLQAETVKLKDRAMIAANSSGSGPAGTVGIEARDLGLQQDSIVTTGASQSSGGAIAIGAHRVELEDSQVTAAVQGEADTLGGDIDIDATSSVVLHNSSVSASANEGQGGNIRIAATDAVVLRQSTIRAIADIGQGGNINIETGGLLVDALSRITATAGPAGIDGMVGIRAVTTDLKGTVTPLPQRFAATPSLLELHCAQRLRGGHISSFIVAGRAGLPADPSGGLPSFLVDIPEQTSPTQQALGPLPLEASMSAPAASGWGPCPQDQPQVARRQP